ncbi:hypothetical protein SAMN05660976_00467 [Nonomuraea pusilla]|uniref:Ig-like domain-containing protein n=1 Tax=Nonomuraea pusilla TaxID=46177 RepID=A0A1H7GR28_9ACTN|nr:hypothetical protein SAMN05660976_00467 [Nonomuraea pusilla]
MKKRLSLLSSVLALCAGLAVAAPAQAAQAATASAQAAPVKVAVGKVKATPPRQDVACPTTVGFSAVIAAKGDGVVRYRWVRGDGSRGAVKSIRVRGAKKVVVKDRQTFQESVSGWQAVQVIGRKGLSAKARFTVSCQGPVVVYDERHPLPASHGGGSRPVESAASVTADPPSYAGACPTSVGFTGVIQVSRVPARVVYQWIDSATGESAPEVAEFGPRDARTRTVTRTLPVSASGTGWKAIHILSGNGHDSGRAAYAVTCSPQTLVTATAAVDQPSYNGACPVTLTFTGRVTVSRGPADVEYRWIDDKGGKGPTQKLRFPDKPGPASVTPLPLQVTADAKGRRALEILSPEQKIVWVDYSVACAKPDDTRVDISGLEPGDYTGDCTGGVDYSAMGRVTVPAGPAREVPWTWYLDGVAAGNGVLRLPASDKERTADVQDWEAKLSASGPHTLQLKAGTVTVSKSFTLTCKGAPGGEPKITINGLTAHPASYVGRCPTNPMMYATAVISSDRAASIRYRWELDGQQVAVSTVEIGGGGGSVLVESVKWQRLESKLDGKVALVVESHNKPVATTGYSVTCSKVQIKEVAAAPANTECPKQANLSATLALTEGGRTYVNFRWYAKAAGETTWKPLHDWWGAQFDKPEEQKVGYTYRVDSTAEHRVKFKLVLMNWGLEKETQQISLGCIN